MAGVESRSERGGMTDADGRGTVSAGAASAPEAGTVSALFRDAVRTAPGHRFLATEREALSYAQAADWSRAVASGLAVRGITRGDRVASGSPGPRSSS